MALRRVRRDGNSLVVTIPSGDAQKAHVTEGTMVDIYTNENSGAIEIHPVEIRHRRDFVAAGREVIEKNRGLLNRLEEYDKGSAPKQARRD
ncbi:MAG TPA: hypothetical protein VFZ25_12015 [Chloroflexota bacterium]|nr:hypothetical protein [Chloroflexota bacterium]